MIYRVKDLRMNFDCHRTVRLKSHLIENAISKSPAALVRTSKSFEY